MATFNQTKYRREKQIFGSLHFNRVYTNAYCCYSWPQNEINHYVATLKWFWRSSKREWCTAGNQLAWFLRLAYRFFLEEFTKFEFIFLVIFLFLLFSSAFSLFSHSSTEFSSFPHSLSLVGLWYMKKCLGKIAKLCCCWKWKN